MRRIHGRAKGGVVLGFDIQTEAIPSPILAIQRVGMDYARVNLKFRQALLWRSEALLKLAAQLF